MDTLKVKDRYESLLKRFESMETLLLTKKTVLTFSEAALYTGLSKSYLYKLTSTGNIPCYKPNGKVLYFDRQELEQWMLQNRNITRDEVETKANTYLAISKKGGRYDLN